MKLTTLQIVNLIAIVFIVIGVNLILDDILGSEKGDTRTIIVFILILSILAFVSWREWKSEIFKEHDDKEKSGEL